MRVLVDLRQSGRGDWSLSKEIELPVCPVPGMLLEYESGWGCASLVTEGERGLHVYISSEEVSISGYGPRFTDEQAASLVAKGWADSRVKA